MSPTHHQKFELFEAFKQGKLSGEDMQSFSNKLLTDANFNQAYNDFLISSEIIKQYELNNIQNILDKIDYTNYKEKGGNGKAGLITTGVVLLAGLATYVGYQNKDTNSISIERPSTKTTVNVAANKNTIQTQETSTPTREVNKTSNTNTPAIATTLGDKINSIVEGSHNQVIENSNSVTLPTQNESIINEAENKHAIVPTAPCVLSCNIVTTGTCPDKNAGAIQLENLGGGSSPYKIELIDNNETLDYETDGNLTISNLTAGNYSIRIKDNSENCIKEFNKISIKNLSANHCIKEINTVFNTRLGETWTSPVVDDNSSLEIKTLGGTLVLKQSINENESTEWNGNNSGGSPQSPGVYFFTIENQKGVIVYQGTITIIN